MRQITIYLDEATENRLKASARGTGLSVSRFIANLIREKTATEWPASVVALAGAWADFPEVEELRAGSADRAADPAEDEPRENL